LISFSRGGCHTVVLGTVLVRQRSTSVGDVDRRARALQWSSKPLAERHRELAVKLGPSYRI
jgi:hypothetical protein